MNNISFRRRGRIRTTSAATLATAMALMFALAISVAPAVTSARTLAPVGQGQGLNPMTIPAGGSATLTVKGFCLDFGKPFPTDNTTTSSLADDKVRAALNYSIGKGYTEGNPAQVELAIWYLRDGNWHATEHVIGQEIVDNATTANVPASTGTGLSLSDAVTQNKVTVESKFIAQTSGHFYGDTTLQIQNPGNADVQIFMPVGTVFTVPNGGGQFQDLAAYALGPQGTQQAVTSTATTEPTTTAIPTATTVPTTEATSTTAATIELPTATVAATIAVATPTSMAIPASTSMPVTSPLPQTGVGGDNYLPITLTSAALMLVVLGFVMKLKQSNR